MSKSDPAGWKTAENLVNSFSGKLLKIVAIVETKMHQIRFRVGLRIQVSARLTADMLMHQTLWHDSCMNNFRTYAFF